MPTRKIISRFKVQRLVFGKEEQRIAQEEIFEHDDVRNELQLFLINSRIQKHLMEWSQHVDRMKDRRLTKVIFRYIKPLVQEL